SVKAAGEDSPPRCMAVATIDAKPRRFRTKSVIATGWRRTSLPFRGISAYPKHFRPLASGQIFASREAWGWGRLAGSQWVWLLWDQWEGNSRALTTSVSHHMQPVVLVPPE